MRKFNGKAVWLSGYDIQKYTAGFTRYAEINAGTIDAVAAEYATRRKQSIAKAKEDRKDAKKHGKKPRKVWGIERDLIIDPQILAYRVGEERIVEWDTSPLVTYADPGAGWQEIGGQLTALGYVVNVIAARIKNRE